MTKEQVTRVVEGNTMAALTNVFIENAEFFRDSFKMNMKRDFNRLMVNAGNLFKLNNLSEDELQHLQSLTDAIHDSVYELKVQYRKHIEENEQD